MTVEDSLLYLAAHAPHEIPEWFKVEMPELPRPPELPEKEVLEKALVSLGKERRYTVHALMESCHDWRRGCDGGWQIDEKIPSFEPWCSQWRAYWKEREQHSAARMQMRMFHWPWFWARMVLAARPAQSNLVGVGLPPGTGMPPGASQPTITS